MNKNLKPLIETFTSFNEVRKHLIPKMSDLSVDRDDYAQKNIALLSTARQSAKMLVGDLTNEKSELSQYISARSSDSDWSAKLKLSLEQILETSGVLEMAVFAAEDKFELYLDMSNSQECADMINSVEKYRLDTVAFGRERANLDNTNDNGHSI